jgi:toluene monooxygenase system protein E
MHQLRAVRPSFGEQSRAIWQQSPEWQPLRKVVETLLVTYDFGEAWVALNLALKPMFDHLFTVELAKLAADSGDPRLGQLLFSLSEDWRWHREVSRGFVRFAIEDRAENHALIQGWLQRWQPQVRAAFTALLPLFGASRPAALQALAADCRAFWSAMGLEGGPE